MLPPVEAYVFTMPGCGHCERTKDEVVPVLREAGVFVVVLEALFHAHERYGFTPKAYPTWLFARMGQKEDVLVGFRPAKEILKVWRSLRGG